MPGVLNASGIQVIAAGPATPIQKIRDAITGLEVNDLTADVIVMGPADWAAVETTADGNGRHLLDASPVDRADRRLWDVPVVVSTVMPANTAAVLNAQSVAVATDGKLKINLAQPGEDFNRNLYTIRTEMRAYPALIRAFGVVRVNLAAS